MLSRVAESLFWGARSIERAENTSRLFDVSFHGLLDTPVADPEQEWSDLLRAIGRDELFREHFDDYTPRAVTEFLLWHPANPDSVTASVARARENFRGVREQISSEMWEHLNRLHLLVSRTRHSRVLDVPHDFLVRVREGSHAFQGVTKATLSRGEAFEFVELGAHLERADATARVLLTGVPRLVDGPGGRLWSLLRSCGGFEAFRRNQSEDVQGERVVEFLLLDRSFPRSVLFCAERCLEAVRFISGNSQQLERAVGMLVARLTFADVPQLDPPSLGTLLGDALGGVHAVGNEISDAYFETRVVLPGPYAQQQQQQ
ncbi:MAG TPA: alpha-E domain-containing protein [Gaiellaceae bacterium]|nr:alpha-E domain-containing protein [Gaiellaceae bacterium]